MINSPNEFSDLPSDSSSKDQDSLNNNNQEIIEEELTEIPHPSLNFETHFEGCMEMYSEIEIVSEYLKQHEGWFCRCAQPMTAEPLGENGYILTIGRFGALGYELEPKMAVILEPPQNQIYDMYSIPVPDYIPPGYEVDYQASMQLSEIPVHESYPGLKETYKKHKITDLPKIITQVKWQLHLYVSVQFPKFIYKLPINLIQKTGNRVLAEIIKQVSPRLTYKVQKDFHDRFELPLPAKIGRRFQRIDLSFSENQISEEE